MKKTKIICSIGPASCKYDVMKEMILNGMNVARINFSHATMEERKEAKELVDGINEELGTNVAILFDTKGPDFRTGNLKNDYINLKNGEEIKIVKDDILGTEEAITVNYKDVIDDLKVGDIILLEDGLMKLEVISSTSENGGGVVCKIICGGKLGERKGINVPGVRLNVPFISEVDREDIKYACDHKGDFLALSFVSCKEDLIEARNLTKEYGHPNIKLVSKVESDTAIENIDDIVEYSDAVMVARGDLGVEVPMEEVPMLQKLIIKKCREQNKICIVATEMLASMYTNARPTRAEVTDIANAVLDGTDSVMLSGETTIGKYPIEAVGYMASICQTAEKLIDYDVRKKESNPDITGAIAHSVVETAAILDARLIVAATMSGYTARKISNLKPKSLVLAACPSREVAQGLALNWGVYATITSTYNSTDEIVSDARKKAIDFIDINKDDIMIVTGGFPNNTEIKATNFMKIEQM